MKIFDPQVETRPASSFDLEPLVIEAVFAFGGSPDGVFTTGGFLDAIMVEFGVKFKPNLNWCSEVLSKLPYVRGQACGFWLYRGDLTAITDRGQYSPRKYRMTRAIRNFTRASISLIGDYSDWMDLARIYGALLDPCYGPFIRFHDGLVAVMPGNGRITRWIDSGSPPLRGEAFDVDTIVDPFGQPRA